MLLTADPLSLDGVPNLRDLTQRDFLCPRRGIHVQVLDVGELGSLFHAQLRDDRDLLVALS